MTTYTFLVDLLEDEWFQLTTGQITGELGLFYVTISEGNVAICLSDTPPSVGEENYISLDSGIPHIHLELDYEEIVFLCGKGGPAKVRGYRLPRKVAT